RRVRGRPFASFARRSKALAGCVNKSDIQGKIISIPPRHWFSLCQKDSEQAALLGGLLRIHPVALELLAQPEARETQLLRGPALVPAVPEEGRAEEPSLEVFHERL